MLTLEQQAARKGRLTASRVAVLMHGDPHAIYNLWLELTNQPYEEADLSGNWPVQLGSVTEQLNLDWYARKHGQVSRRGEVVLHDLGPFAATLDGWDENAGCPIECKHVSGFEPLETIIDRYQPQMHWQMIVTGATRCALSVIMGAQEPVVEMIDYDGGYGLEMQLRASSFMEHVKARTKPVELPPVAVPVLPTREVDMTGSNEWGSYAASWLGSHEAAKTAKKADTELKLLVPADAKLARGHGVRITRDRAGRMALREDRV